MASTIILSDNGASSGSAGLKSTAGNDGVLILQTTTSGGTATAGITINNVQGVLVPNTIGVGGATPSTSGAGITFPAAQSASSDANTLDDYEEGTWTGTLTGGTTAPATPQTSTGIYTKVGRIVSVAIQFANVNTTGASGTVKVTGLPFTSNSNSLTLGSVVNNRGPNQQSSSYVSTGSTDMVQVDYSGGGTSWASVGSGTYAYFTITYQTP